MGPDFDSYITGGQYRAWIRLLTCPNGHKWAAAMYDEYGGTTCLPREGPAGPLAYEIGTMFNN